MRRKRLLPYILTFLLAMGAWIILSGRFDAFHLALGVASSLLVSFLTADLLFYSDNMDGLGTSIYRFIRYLPWLLWQIMLANIHVMKLIFHPRMHELINPKIIRFESRLHSDVAHLIFANSITLTPGTITVYVSIFGYYTVHVIDTASAEGLPGEMEQRVGHIFGE